MQRDETYDAMIQRIADTALEHLKQEAAVLEAMFSAPWDDRFNVRVWDATYVLAPGEPVVAMVIQRADSVPNLPKFQASVTPRYGDESSEVKNFADSDATPLMLAYFMRLDTVLSAYRPTWVLRRQTTSSNLSIVRGSVTDRRLH